MSALTNDGLLLSAVVCRFHKASKTGNSYADLRRIVN